MDEATDSKQKFLLTFSIGVMIVISQLEVGKVCQRSNFKGSPKYAEKVSALNKSNANVNH